MFALKEFVDFPLGSGATVDGAGVIFFGFTDMETSCTKTFLYFGQKMSELSFQSTERSLPWFWISLFSASMEE